MYSEAVQRHIDDRPDAISVISEGRHITWAELGADVDGVSAWLSREGLSPGDVVGLTIGDEYRHLVTALALMRLACTQIILPSHEPMPYRASLATRTKAVAVIASDSSDGVASTACLVPDFAYRPERPLARHDPDPHAACMYVTSSGTTGKPKIAPITQAQLFHQSVISQYPPSFDILYRPSSIEYNNGKRHRLYVCALGGINVFAKESRVDIFETCTAHNVTRLSISAAQSMRLVNRAAAGEGHLPPDTLVRLGGSAVGQSLRLRITRHLSPNLHVAYATSDFGPIATAGPEHHADKPDALGVVHPGVQFEIVGEDGGGLPHGETGQIRLRGPGMSTRYLDDAEATARAFRGGWFYPGDMGFIDADGVGYFEGRSDDMMNFASINVFPSEIERVIEGFSGVTECAAFAIRSRSFGEIPAVAVVGPPASVEREIAVYARQQLGLRAPRKVILVDAIPRNSAGKIDRAALERMAVPDKSNEAGKLDGG